ncbi:fibronectin type III domain-containing protein [Radiobacillus kanasensis]|nr:fibronectin type III domain-containing protein [Radiobacillus kanasensis]
MTWDAVSYDEGISNYEIYRDGVSVGTSATTSYSDSGLTASTTYSYQVKAIGANGKESALSTAVSVTTSAA